MDDISSLGDVHLCPVLPLGGPFNGRHLNRLRSSARSESRFLRLSLSKVVSPNELHLGIMNSSTLVRREDLKWPNEIKRKLLLKSSSRKKVLLKSEEMILENSFRNEMAFKKRF
ncbi:hypothetical protein VNO78_20994 [Psophocarpus tetragonolobus]|uniref:Uncharacterized protein n=1 Tax=Psophocarpus tetragonolobus TaxID=3891 RepID=A0AAN9SBF7_PSOTE